MHTPSNDRIFSAAALCGAVFLGIGTMLHPMEADPNVPAAVFAEYAADRHWIASHLMQLLGFVLMIAALVLLAHRMRDGRAARWAALGTAGAIGSLAAGAVLQAVDGIALKAMVDTWMAASGSDKASLFHAAFGMRQLETGLASIASLMLGLTVFAFGTGFLVDGRIPKWTGWLGILAGLATAAGGVLLAYDGFSERYMAVSMPANLLLLGWLIALAVVDWRTPLFSRAADVA